MGKHWLELKPFEILDYLLGDCDIHEDELRELWEDGIEEGAPELEGNEDPWDC